jgi:pimeloyl-ACP methyl ester carboxylesterase
MAHHAAAPGAYAVFAASAYPAMLDPKFAGTIADPLWDTTVRGTRGRLFYEPATSDPRVIAWDEQSKDVLSATGAVTGAVSLVTPAPLNISRLVTAPVLIMNGSEDAIFCAGTGNCSSGTHLAQTEQPYFPRAALVDGAVVPGTGHDLNLSTTSATSFREINGWLSSVPPQH